jgi:hypothetical protein
MRTHKLKSRLLGLVGSTGIAAGMASPAACGGASVQHGDAGEAGEAGTTGGTAAAGKGGTSNSSSGGSTSPGTGGGKQPGTGGAGGFSTGGTITGGTTATGGLSSSSGGASGGGTSGAGGSGGRDLPSNCYDSGVGVCCSEPRCLSVTEAWELAGRNSAGGSGGSTAGAGGEAGAESVAGAGNEAGAGGVGDVPLPSSCPTGADLGFRLCYWYEGEPTPVDGQCCYEFTSGSCCGRPFVVHGEARLPVVVSRSDWLQSVPAASTELDAAARRALMEEWLADARLEHASIASFSRFLLELLSLGAPATFVEHTQRALAEEIAHTRLCFGLASKYAERPLGPGALDIADGVAATNLAEVAARAVIEGCVGETIAALQAEAELEQATETDVRHALEIIRSDEAAHAELAWSFVRWAVDQGDESVLVAVRRAFAAAERSLRAERAEPGRVIDRRLLHAHGRLTPAERLACHLEAFDSVIAPCRDTLLAGRSTGRAAPAAHTPGALVVQERVVLG